ARAERAVREQPVQPGGKRIHILGRDQPAALAVADQLARPEGAIGRERGRAAGERLGQCIGETLPARGKDEEAGPLYPGPGIVGEGLEADAVGNAELTRKRAQLRLALAMAENDEVVTGRRRAGREGAEQEV